VSPKKPAVEQDSARKQARLSKAKEARWTWAEAVKAERRRVGAGTEMLAPAIRDAPSRALMTRNAWRPRPDPNVAAPADW